ncbi:MAG: DUF2334 domain-containing protein [Eubacteriales bacterium]|nr:DUF2334 domain-containing protein [Eubacteriales bacterium]
MRKRIMAALAGLLLLMTAGCSRTAETFAITEYASKSENTFSSQRSEEEKACLSFIRSKMMKDGGVYTEYLDHEAGEELSGGHEILAESEGLLLEYAVRSGDEELYGEVKEYIAGVLEQDGYLSYRIEQDGTPRTVNAAVDDLRIIRGLYEGGDEELALVYAGWLRKTNVKNGLVVDYYSAEEDQSGDEMTLCYGDLTAMEYAARENPKWEEIRDRAEEVMCEGYLGDGFPFFHTRYHVQKQTYSSEDINMVESLLTVNYLSEVGRCPARTIEWMKEAVAGDGIYGSYSIDGQPLNKVESTAIYALCAMIAGNTGEQELYDMALERMLELQVTDKQSEVYGAFADSGTLKAHSFDNLTALLALRISGPGKGTDRVEDTFISSSDDQREILEQLVKGCGKTAVFESDGARAEQEAGKYTYVITTKEQTAQAALDSGCRVFSVGTENAYGIQEGLSYRKDTFAALDLGNVVQSEKKQKGLFYLDEISDGESFGRMQLPFGEEAPYAVVKDGYGYASYVRGEDLSTVALSSALHSFFGAESPEGRFFVMIDEVYPFSDMNMLTEMGEDLYERGIPYILRVMPVYENTSYPSYGEFTEKLKYLQAKGASVVLHEPIDQGEGYGPDTRENKLARSRWPLENAGVQIFPYEQEPVSLNLDFLKDVTAGEKQFPELPADTVIQFSVFEDKEEWEETLAFLEKKWFTVSDYRSLYTDEIPVYQKKTEESSYSYRETTEAAMEGFFNKSSRILIVVVVAAIGAFGVILAGSRRIYKQKFRRSDRKKENK